MPATAGPVTYRTISSAEAFADLAEAWESLYARAGCAAASLTGAAVRAFLTHRVLAGQEPLVVLAEVDSLLVGALPLVGHRKGGRLTYSTFSDLQTYGVDFVIDAAYDAAYNGSLRAGMIQALLREYPQLFSIQLADVREDSPSVHAMQSLGDVYCHVDVNRRASYLTVPASADEIPSLFSQNFRKNLRKQETRLRTLPDVRFEFVCRDAAGPEHFERFVALEASGWKGANGTAIGSRPDTLSFYRDLSAGLMQTGMLEMHFLWVSRQVVGAHFGVRTPSTLNLLKIAYDEGHSHYGPGNMLFLELLRREAASQAAREIDCLTDMPWHQNWRMASRRYLTVTLFPRRMAPALLGYLPLRGKDVLRSSPAVRSMVRAIRGMRSRGKGSTGSTSSADSASAS